MIVKKVVKEAFSIKGKLHIPDVIGVNAAREIGVGKSITCVFHSPEGAQYEVLGKVAFELINYKGRQDNLDDVGGSLIFDENPNGQIPKGWEMFIYVES